MMASQNDKKGNGKMILAEMLSYADGGMKVAVIEKLQDNELKVIRQTIARVSDLFKEFHKHTRLANAEVERIGRMTDNGCEVLAVYCEREEV